MTPDEVSEKLMQEFYNYDTERAHEKADELLCDLLRVTHPRTVEAFERLHKWYA